MMLSMQDMPLKGKRVLMREDFNVPLDEQGHIVSRARIEASLPGIRLALDQGAAVMLLSHLGRPKGVTPELSLAPVAACLSECLNQSVSLVKDWLTQPISVAPGTCVLLENVRFLEGETTNDNHLATTMASLCDVFVMDAFAVAHRESASTVGLPLAAKVACAGPLLTSEIAVLDRVMQQPKRPCVAICGGAKIETKLALLKSLLQRVDSLVLAGGIANTCGVAKGYSLGASLYQPDWVSAADELLSEAARLKKQIVLPQDVMVADARSKARLSSLTSIEPEEKVLDFGPKTNEALTSLIHTAGTVIWNGPIGVFEQPDFSEGTFSVVRAMAETTAYTLAGGGETIAAIEAAAEAHLASPSYKDQFDYISTGGAAFLAYLEGRALPGIQALQRVNMGGTL